MKRITTSCRNGGKKGKRTNPPTKEILFVVFGVWNLFFFAKSHQDKPCSKRHLTKDEIKQIFAKARNFLVKVKENVVAELTELIDNVCRTEALVEEHDSVERELVVLAERLETLIRENARVAQDQTVYLKQENEEL